MINKRDLATLIWFSNPLQRSKLRGYNLYNHDKIIVSNHQDTTFSKKNKEKKQLANWQVKILTTTTPTYSQSFITDSKIAIAAREPEAMVENGRVSVPLKSDQCNTI